MVVDPQLSRALREAQHVVVLTGAGISAESGIPTFRDKQTGLWERFDAAELASASAFERDAALVWGWYEWRRMLVLRAEPNPGHRAIAILTERVPHLTLITQNVDDLHERAGSRQLLHLHGELARPYCEACGKPHALPTEIPAIPRVGMRIEPPRCASCGGRIRPGVVWFGESLPQREWAASVEAATHCNVFLSVGTSSVVQPAASLTELAIRAGAVTVQVNPNETSLDAAVTFAMRGPAGAILPELVRAAWGAAEEPEPKPELLLRIDAEGGSIAMYGNVNDPARARYKVGVVDQTLTFLNEDERGPEIRRDSGWLTDWTAAIAALDRYPWPRLAVRYVHPRIAQDLWQAAQDYAQRTGREIPESSLRRWRQACEHPGPLEF